MEFGDGALNELVLVRCDRKQPDDDVAQPYALCFVVACYHQPAPHDLLPGMINSRVGPGDIDRIVKR